MFGIEDFQGVKNNGFIVEVIGGQHCSTPGGEFVELRHGQQYSLKVVNCNSLPCRLNVKIDNTDMGTFQMKEYTSYNLERPASQASKFTFYRVKNAPAGSKIKRGKTENGLITCSFTPKEGANPAKIHVCAPMGRETRTVGFRISDQATAEELVNRILEYIKFKPGVPKNVENIEIVQWKESSLGCVLPKDAPGRVKDVGVDDGNTYTFSILKLKKIQIFHGSQVMNFDLKKRPCIGNLFNAVLQREEWNLNKRNINITTMDGRTIITSFSGQTACLSKRSFHIYEVLRREEILQYGGQIKLKVLIGKPKDHPSELYVMGVYGFDKDTSTSIMFDVHDRIEYLMERIQQQIGWPIQQIQLSWGPNVSQYEREELCYLTHQQRRELGLEWLEDDKTVADYGIKPLDILHLYRHWCCGGDGKRLITSQTTAPAPLRNPNDGKKRKLDTQHPAWCAGATALEGESKQRFKTAPPIEVDETLEVKISMRLVARTDEDIVYHQLSTPIPVPVPE